MENNMQVRAHSRPQGIAPAQDMSSKTREEVYEYEEPGG
jgi:hypothetical protein